MPPEPLLKTFPASTPANKASWQAPAKSYTGQPRPCPFQDLNNTGYFPPYS
ncbi:hypothetical protein I79_010152 [Cricetulus griseus]|uniref:Uncharacterized protein n=1 Tax=Cricetulus griseus TaxID=10029 RepID=G3HHP6_CRIGR|nr:hypothetical protein I79_010152 [Cricetulus griseus]